MATDDGYERTAAENRALAVDGAAGVVAPLHERPAHDTGIVCHRLEGDEPVPGPARGSQGAEHERIAVGEGVCGSGVVGDRGAELLEAVAALAGSFPVPDPAWHGWVPEIQACLDDLRQALAAAAQAPAALELALGAVEGDLEAAFDPHRAGPRLAAAYRRLGALPVPAGEHPYLDEIVPALEALEALLVAVSLVPEAAALFERLG